MFLADQILLETMLTEKATVASSELNKYTFKVTDTANRKMVAAAIERTFKVKVSRVHIINVKPKQKPSRTRRGEFRTRPGYKKAIITLQAGDKIDFTA